MTSELWRHASPDSTRMWEFKEHVNKKYTLTLDGYSDLYQWSIDNVAPFWEETWNFTRIKASRKYSKVVDDGAPMFPRPDFFQGSLLNFAENILYPAGCTIDESCPAIIAATESTRDTVTWAQLRERVRQCAASMRSMGVKESDRVAGFLANHTNTVVTMLAATSIGAIWTGVSPDTGVSAVLDRLVQIEPVILFADNAVAYNGKLHDGHEKIQEIVRELKGLQALVVFDTVPGHKLDLKAFEVARGTAMTYHDFLISASDPDLILTFAQLPPSHAVYILYSSGTTGKPKCIVHSAIGTLIQHKKEHILHCDMRPHDRLFYFTTCSWMMWHFLISGLASGVTLILYDGSPFHPSGPLSMPLLIQELRITHFGTSAKYLSMLEQKSVFPLSSGIDLSSLKAIYSTGSPLAPSTFRYVYNAFPPTINLGSITGGTDIISLFGAPCPLLPVHAGEIQCKGLGMAIYAYDPNGSDISATGEAGDLVCTKAFPCQPVAFFGADGPAKYRASYFEAFAGVWHHGDFIRFNRATGGLVMLGRSDGILKPAGVRFGSAEIYNVLLKHFPPVDDALCIGRRRETDADETVVLFLKMADGAVCDATLVERIRAVIRRELSARHVPGVVDACPEIPLTANGKKVEVAVKQILCGLNVKISASVANAECLEWYRTWAREN